MAIESGVGTAAFLITLGGPQAYSVSRAQQPPLLQHGLDTGLPAPSAEGDLHWLSSGHHCPGTTDNHPDRAFPPTDTRSNPPHTHRQKYGRSNWNGIAAAHSLMESCVRSNAACSNASGLSICTPALWVCHSFKFCGRQNLGQRISLVEGFRLGKFRRQLRRHGRAGLIVLRIIFEDSRISSPMLVELGRELDEVARH